MQHILGTILRDNEAEVLDDITPGRTPYSLMGLHAAILVGQKRITQNPNVKQINIYKVHDGVRSISSEGRYELVHRLLGQNPQD